VTAFETLSAKYDIYLNKGTLHSRVDSVVSATFHFLDSTACGLCAREEQQTERAASHACLTNINPIMWLSDKIKQEIESHPILLT